MSQDEFAGSTGYALKRAQAALNAAMEARLRPLGLGVSQYACLAQIDRRPGLSNADLARAVFVSRQATHQLLAGLTSAGLVEVTGSGRGRRLSLGTRGRTLLAAAEELVTAAEEQMVAGLSVTEDAELRARLTTCADALERAPSGTTNPRP